MSETTKIKCTSDIVVDSINLDILKNYDQDEENIYYK